MKQRLEGVPLKKILKEVPLEQRLEGLEDEQIEAFLARKKKKSSPKECQEISLDELFGGKKNKLILEIEEF